MKKLRPERFRDLLKWPTAPSCGNGLWFLVVHERKNERKDWISQQWPCPCCVPATGTKRQPLFSSAFCAIVFLPSPPPHPPTFACETPEGTKEAKQFAQAPQSRIRLLKAAFGTLLPPVSRGLLLNWNGFNLYKNESYSWKQSTFGIARHRDSPKSPPDAWSPVRY